MASFNAAVALSVLNVAASVLHHVDLAEPTCDETVNNSFMSDCGLLKSDPGNFVGAMGIVKFETPDEKFCVSKRNPKNSFTTLTVKEQFEVQPSCCNSEEQARIAQSATYGSPAERAHAVFDSLGNGTLAGLSYYEVIPYHCSKGARCPLVIMISGSGGHPWPIGLSLCTTCKAEMKVVMIAPMLGGDEDTEPPFARHIVRLASKYVETASNVDPERVYLASVSRGNEIGIQAAIFGAHIFKAVVMTGKFEIPATLRSAKFPTGKLKLGRVVLNNGDEDDELPDKEFYKKFTGLATVMAKAVVPPNIDLYIYRGAGHDVTWVTWNEMYSVLWTGRDE